MTYEGQMHFDPEDGIYVDHFPGHPVVPGSLIVQGFVAAVNNITPLASLDLSHFRFKRFVSPGTYRYTLMQDEKDIRCTLFDGKKAVVTGKVSL